MSNLNLSVPNLAELKPRITVFGVGGGGCNAVNNMIESNLTGVEFVVANTDAQALAKSKCERRIQMGNALTQGLGAGSQPEIGAGAAEETLAEIIDHLAGSHMVFITAGMGGGTGTGAAPVIARAAKEQGILTVGVVTKPFNFEGKRRMAIAENGIENLSQFVDTLIVIPNQNLFLVANEKTSFTAAFSMADQVLYSGVASITELMTKEGLINLDFADVRAVMADMGKAMMGTGEASGEKRAIESADAAISNPLLDDVSMAGARGVLISIAGGPDLALYEVDEAATRIREEVDPDANIIVGATIEEELEGTMRVSVVATGLIDESAARSPEESTRTEPDQPQIYAGGMGASPVYNGGCIVDTAAPQARPTQVEESPAEQPEMASETAQPQPSMLKEDAPSLPLDEPVVSHVEETAMPEPQPRPRPVAEEAHAPAPDAPRIPPLEEFPQPIRENAIRKAEQISAIARPKSRRSLIERLAKLGRRGKTQDGASHAAADEPRVQAPCAPAHEAPVRPAPQADNVHPLNVPEEPVMDSEHDIPAFLRRS